LARTTCADIDQLPDQFRSRRHQSAESV
jgi:hypothetical protein